MISFQKASGQKQTADKKQNPHFLELRSTEHSKEEEKEKNMKGEHLQRMTAKQSQSFYNKILR